ncbi:MAG: HAMP domain-containing histidine kinase, partial [bacterium]|nr:HAMP domain-containing histidine kinase [bacterium]
ALAHLPAAVVLFRPEGELVYSNLRAREILVELAGKVPVRLDEALGLVPDGEVPDGEAQEVVLEALDGTPVHLGYKARAVTGQASDHQLFVLVFEDITGTVTLRRQRDHYLKISSISRLLPTIAHRILNPLAGIQALLEVVREESESRRHRDDLKAALSDIAHIGQLVRGLGLAVRDRTVQELFVDLVPVMEQEIRRWTEIGERYDVAISTRWPNDVWCQVDPDAVRQLVGILIENALQACSSGDSVDVQLENQIDRVALMIADTGCGMDATTLDRATEPFFTTRPRCSGIGLTLAAEVAENCGGGLRLSSRPGEGSKVSVWFPVLAERGTPSDTDRRLSLDLDDGQPLNRRSER